MSFSAAFRLAGLRLKVLAAMRRAALDLVETGGVLLLSTESQDAHEHEQDLAICLAAWIDSTPSGSSRPIRGVRLLQFAQHHDLAALFLHVLTAVFRSGQTCRRSRIEGLMRSAADVQLPEFVKFEMGTELLPNVFVLALLVARCSGKVEGLPVDPSRAIAPDDCTVNQSSCLYAALHSR